MIKNLLFLLLLFTCYQAAGQMNAPRYSVLIDEIMADPTPVTRLPDAEWIELRNCSGFDINLQGWRLGKASGQSGPLPAYVLRADSFVIVCSGGAAALLSPIAPVVTVTGFPSLSNTGDLVFLKSHQGNIIHSVNFKDHWYRNELKRNGGWSLEMIDTKNPCSGNFNWSASTDVKGGTPGKKNSVDSVNSDVVSPRLIRAVATDSLNVILVFNEPLDSTNAASAANYNITDGIVVTSATTVPVSFDKVKLTLAAPLLRGKTYIVTVTNGKDCSGNNISNSSNIVKLGLGELTDSLDIVVNEILFNPRSNGKDYVELYNRSKRIVNLRNMFIAHRATNGAIASVVSLCTEDNLFFPGDFIVLTESIEIIKNDFVTINADAFIELTSLPAYNDDNGSVVLLNQQGKIIDEVTYSEKWHFKLISNNEGIALERIDYNGTSNSPENWHSAAANINYGTPTYKNSQYRVNEGVQGEVNVAPPVFSPDNDGMDDFATLQYVLPQAGYVANITVFDAAGRPVRFLQRNVLSGVNGSYKWDGLDERNRKLPVGLYIFYTEIFNLEGKVKRFKNTIVLARKN